ncbi:hypothetical protein [Streptacidiphilus sp. PAMC 29251]
MFASLGGGVFLATCSLTVGLRGALPTRSEGFLDAVSKPAAHLLILLGVLFGLALVTSAIAAIAG